MPPRIRLQAVPVTLSQQTATDANGTWVSSSHTLTLYPDENGCVFAQVPTGTYTVAAGQPTSGQARRVQRLRRHAGLRHHRREHDQHLARPR